MIAESIYGKYGFKNGLDISGDSIEKWPYDEKKPTKTELKKIIADYSSSKEVEDIKKSATELYNEIENHFYIKANGRAYNFDISKKIDFFAKFVMMPDDGALLWTAHDNVEYPHTKEEALNVFIAAEAFLKPLFDAKKADKSGDGSLPNLNAIKTAQEAF
jgi:hypothetical protein